MTVEEEIKFKINEATQMAEEAKIIMEAAKALAEDSRLAGIAAN